MMNKVYILISYLTIFGIQSISSQNTRLLPVNKVIQKGDVLCWAACMEMIFSYSNPSNTYNQCFIAEKMKTHYGSGKVECTPCPTNCNTTISDISNCNFSAQKKYIKLLLSDHFNYHLRDALTPNWETIKTDVNNNHPFIGFMGYPTKECTSDHVVLIRGYQSTGRNKYYLINDPQNLCNQPNFQKILFSNDKRVMTVCAYLNEMFATNVQAFNIINPDSLTTQPDKELPWQGEIIENLSQKQLDSLIKDNNYAAVEKIYYDIRSQKGFSTSELTYLNTTSPYTRTTLQKIDNQWIPVKIEQTQQDFFEIVQPKKNDIILTPRPDKLITSLEVKPYKKVILIPTGHQFYFFYIGKDLHFLPITGDITYPKQYLTIHDMKRLYKVGLNFLKVIQ